ncbi:MAG: hypothetical protein IKE43_03510 [Coriobacteriales bacterium]|nr:hypothetical protein [Coriobacteriales bacterium]
MITLSLLFMLMILGGLAGIVLRVFAGLFKIGMQIAFLPVMFLIGLFCLMFFGLKLLMIGLPFILIGCALSALVLGRQSRVVM